jgi:chromosome segregation ATPase
MADVNKEIALEVSLKDSTGAGTQSAKQRLREMQKELIAMAEAGQQGTDAFKRLEQQAGELKDEIADVNQRIKNLASDTKTIDAFVGAVQGIAAGFQIAQGAAALFGDENEDLQKAMLKVQGAMALANGVQQVANLLQKESAVMMGINTAATKLYAVVVGTATGALRAFRIALAATGIGAIVVALGFAAEAMGLFGKKTQDAADSEKDLKRSLEDTAGTLEYYERKLKANGATEEDLAKLRKKRFEDQRANVQKELDDVTRINQLAGDALKDRAKTLKDEIDLLTTQIKEQQNIMDDAAKQRGDKEKADRDRRTTQATQLSNELLAIQKKAQDQLALLNADGLRKELLAIDQKYAADLAKLKKYGKDTADLEAVIAKEKLEKEKEFGIQLRNLQQERADIAKEAADKQEQDEIARMQREGARRTAFANSQTEGQKKRLEDEKFIEEQRVKLASDGFNAIGELANAFAGSSEESQKRAFNINKAAGIAQAIIDTYAAAQGAYKSQMTVPDPSAPIRASVAAGIAIAQGLARVAVISKTQFKSTSTGTPPPTPAGTSSSTPAPTFTNPQTTNLGTGELSGGQGQQNQPMRAYVVERDIQQTTSRVRRLSEFATLG